MPCTFFPQDSAAVNVVIPEDRHGQEDAPAIDILTRIFGSYDIDVKMVTAVEGAELTRLLRSCHCLVVGSPSVNPLPAAALGELFGASPSYTAAENRQKLPLVIQVPAEWSLPNPLIENVPTKESRLLISEDGITFDRKVLSATAELDSQADRSSTSDYGVIFAVGRESGIRTYWVGGSSRTGTQAAAEVLAKDRAGFPYRFK